MLLDLQQGEGTPHHLVICILGSTYQPPVLPESTEREEGAVSLQSLHM